MMYKTIPELYQEVDTWAQLSRRNFGIGIFLVSLAVCLGVAATVLICVGTIFLFGSLFGVAGAIIAVLMLICGGLGTIAYFGATQGKNGKWS